MHFTDFHMHSNCSIDAEDAMLDMALAAGEAGMDHVCFTDHCDLDWYLTGQKDERCFDVWPRILQEYDYVQRECPSALEVSLGLELGEANHYPDWARQIAAQPELDFVIGSVHSLRGIPDFYALRYESGEHCRQLLFDYIEELTEMAALDCVDIVSHIGYTKRYMLRAGFANNVEEEIYREPIRKLLRTVIETGKGIEINCSGMRHPGINGPIPGVEILKLYRELGGEIITVGSDAHKVSDAGRGIIKGFELLRELGYSYVTVFRKRKPDFIKIS